MRHNTRKSQSQIPVALINSLRESTGAGVMDCKNALIESDGDIDKATELIKQRGLAKVIKKAGRITSEGLIETYTHPGGRLGAMIEVNCESDFVARTDEFKELAHNLVLQVAASAPLFISDEDLPQDTDLNAKDVCLLFQPFIKDLSKSVQDIVTETIAKTGENIRIRRFIRFELGN